MRACWFALCLVLMIPTGARAQDAMYSGLVRAPMTVDIALPGGQRARLAAYVVRPDRPGRFPLVLLVHGTPRGTGQKFFQTIARMTPEGYLGPAAAMASHGYAVVSILRRGFGASSGPYAEQYNPGGCAVRDYTRIGRISAEDVVGAAEALRSEPWVDPSRVVLMGHSTGGFAVTAAAATNPPGVVGILNFAGGRGSDAPDHVCGEERLIDAFHTFGTTARVPELWVYAQNDHFFGPDLAHRMFAAYTGGGAPARFVMLPPVGSDGHMAIRIAPHEVIWPPVEAFLASLNLPTQPIVTLPALAVLRPPPGLNPGCAAGFQAYAAARTEAKAFAVNPGGHCGWNIAAGSVEDAKQDALRRCNANGPGCAIYAVGQNVVGR